MKVPEPRQLDSGSWFIQLRLGGESIPVTAASEKECRNAAALIKAEHRAGKREKKGSELNPTLSEAIDAFIAARSNTLSPSTIRGYRTIQDNRFQSVMQKKLRDISDWQKICDQESKLCSAKTLKNAFCFIASVLKENGYDVPTVKLPQIIKKELPWLEPEQITVFVAALKDSPCEIPALLALHSLRRSEIMALTWEKINLKTETITISGAAVYDEDQKLTQKKTNKNTSSAREIQIVIPELLTALKAIKDKKGPLLNCSPNTIWAQVNRICESNDLPRVGVHGLRRSFASLAFHLGLSERETMEMGGWSDYQTMHKIYIRLSQKDRLKNKNKMAKFYKNANKNANSK